MYWHRLLVCRGENQSTVDERSIKKQYFFGIKYSSKDRTKRKQMKMKKNEDRYDGTEKIMIMRIDHYDYDK